MSGRIALITILALQVGFVASRALAQDGDDERPRIMPNLRERLEQFRHDLIGVPPPPRDYAAELREERNNPGGPRNMLKKPQQGTPKVAQPTVAQPKGNPTKAPTNKSGLAATPANESLPGAVNSAVVTPPRLEVQSARRAQGAGGAKPIGGSVAPQRASASPSSKPPTVAKPTAKKLVVAPKVAPPVDEKELEGSDVDAEPLVAEKELEEKPTPAQTASPAPKRIVPAPRKVVVVEPDEPEEEEESTPAAKPHREKSSKDVLFTSESPSLAIEVAGPKRVMIGKDADFAVKVVNSGAAANDVIIAVHIPNYADVLSSQATLGTAQPASLGDRQEKLHWRISRLEAHSTETLNLKLVPRKSAPLDLAVQWSFTPESTQAMVEVQEPKLTMTISGPNEALFGQSKIYKLIVSNPGNGDCDNVVVGLLPIGGAGDSVATHRLGMLQAGESKTIDVELTARQAGPITIRAQAYADGGLRTEASEQVLVRRANLLVEVEAPKIKYAGTVGTYHVKVMNAGNATAENVQLAAMLPPEAKYVNSNGGGRLDQQQGKVKWTLGTLQAGAERRFDMQCSLATPGDNRLQFVTTAEGDVSAVALANTKVEALADLKLEVRDPQGPIAVGEDAVYEVCIRNRGTKAAEGVDLAVFFSDGLEAVSAEGGPHEISSGQVVFRPLASLPASDVMVYRIHAKADKGGNHVFRAEVACPSLNTKLAAEETTRFYGDDGVAPLASEALAEPSPSSFTEAPPELPREQ